MLRRAKNTYNFVEKFLSKRKGTKMQGIQRNEIKNIKTKIIKRSKSEPINFEKKNNEKPTPEPKPLQKKTIDELNRNSYTFHVDIIRSWDDDPCRSQ